MPERLLELVDTYKTETKACEDAIDGERLAKHTLAEAHACLCKCKLRLKLVEEEIRCHKKLIDAGRP